MGFSISNKIKELCEENKISISTLERSLGFSAGLISRWDKNSPSTDKITQVADYFSVSIDSLIGRDVSNDTYSIESQFIKKIIYDTKKYNIQWKDCETLPTNVILTIGQESENGIVQVDSMYTFEFNGINIYLFKNFDSSLFLYTIIDDEVFIVSSDSNMLFELLNEIEAVMPRYKTREIVIAKMKDYIGNSGKRPVYLANIEGGYEVVTDASKIK